MPKKPLRLAFMGTPDFAVPVLGALLDAGHEVRAVYCRHPRPGGRGQKARPSPVARAAAALGVPVRTPGTLKDSSVAADFAALGLDAAIVAAYGLILPPAFLQAPRLGCLNVHASLLPRWRGAAPIQRAILAGDAETGITIMAMDEGLDTGSMLLKEATAIAPEMSAGDLHDRLSDLGARLIVEALDGLSAGTLAPTPQPELGVTHAAKIERGEARIDWAKPADEVARQIHAFSPAPGAWFEHDKTRIRVLAADLAAGEGPPGTVLDDALRVACATGALRLTRLQRAGKKALAAAEFIRGHDIPKGARLEHV